MTNELDFVRQLREAFGFVRATKPARKGGRQSIGAGMTNPARLAEIKRLRFEENWTLQEIANK